MKIQFSPPDISQLEIDQVIDTLKSGWITTGPKTKELENRLSAYYQTGKTICLNSATAAMELALRLLGVGEGDEVITTAYTYTASASVAIHVGATLKLVDINPFNFFMDLDQLESMISDKTKAIIPVDIGGVPADYDALMSLVDRKKHIFQPKTAVQRRIGRIAILADAAHSLGAEYKGKKTGGLADFTSFSFHAVKNFTTAEGGALTWSNEFQEEQSNAFYKELQLLSLHGQTKDALSKDQLGGWEYDILAPNFKCNMTDIMASIGLAQLDRYPDLLKRRKELVERYDNAFANTPIQYMKHFTDECSSSCHLYLTNITGIGEKDRNAIITELSRRGIAANVHYKPLPLLTAYRNLGFDIANYPNAFQRYCNLITLPLHTLLKDEEQEYIIKELKDIVTAWKK